MRSEPARRGEAWTTGQRVEIFSAQNEARQRQIKAVKTIRGEQRVQDLRSGNRVKRRVTASVKRLEYGG